MKDMPGGRAAPYTSLVPVPVLYQRLADYLASQPPDVTTVTLTLEEIGVILGRPVSESAHRADWWLMSSNKPHIRALRQVGWRVVRPAGIRYGPRVTFERVGPVP